MSNIKEVHTLEEFEATISTGSKTVVFYHATWCQPCRRMSPFVDKLKSTYGNTVTFLKVDVDSNQETATFADVSEMPTFKFYRRSFEVDVLIGTNKEELHRKVERFAQTAK